MILVWLRHGETQANRERRYCGWSDPALNQVGREQAEEAAEALSGLQVRRIWTSDLLRCRQTAEPLLTQFPEAEVEPTSHLRELSFGEWEGFTYDEIHAQAPEQLQRWLAHPHRVSPPGGETGAEMESRLQRWLDRIPLELGSGDVTVAVSHGGPIRWFISHHLEGDPSRFWERSLPHGGILAVTWEPPKWREVFLRELKKKRGTEERGKRDEGGQAPSV
ncbi:broad specificity phosphatase PhoE [Kroppenstedtia sanguinis]|uniref:Histidine phosphatase family protein n=1 Tax=Kroppenstedtia sanguinis TaxID=1380684 RepID=A0ABW4C9I6_9BACL